MGLAASPEELARATHFHGSVLSHGLDLSVIIPAFEEGQLLSTLLPDLQQVLGGLNITSELLIVTRDRDPLTTAAAERAARA